VVPQSLPTTGVRGQERSGSHWIQGKAVGAPHKNVLLLVGPTSPVGGQSHFSGAAQGTEILSGCRHEHGV